MPYCRVMWLIDDCSCKSFIVMKEPRKRRKDKEKRERERKKERERDWHSQSILDVAKSSKSPSPLLVSMRKKENLVASNAMCNVHSGSWMGK